MAYTAVRDSCSHRTFKIMKDIIGDQAIYIGGFGTLASVSLGTINDMLGICAGVLTCVYLATKIWRTRNADK